MARGKGQGSIYRRSDGRWVAQVELDPSPDGKRRYKRISAPTQRAAEQTLRKLLDQRDKGLRIDHTSSTETWLQAWVTGLGKDDVRESTRDHYELICRRYIIPNIGKVKLAKLSVDDVKRMLANLETQGRAVSTRRQVRAVLGNALQEAQRRGYVERNVASLTKGPKRNGNGHHSILTDDEIDEVLTVASNHRLGIIAALALHLGLRRGEILALKWEHVDLDSGKLSVAGTRKRRKGGGLYTDEPKTQKSRRTLTLDNDADGVLAALRQHKYQQNVEHLAIGPLWRDSGYVVTTQRGGPLDLTEVGRLWRKWLTEAGVTHRPFHITRHTALSRIAEAHGIYVASKVGGHSDMGTTANVYGHISDDKVREALRTLRQSSAT